MASPSLPSWIILHKFVGVALSGHLQAEDFYLFPDTPPRLSHFKIPVGEQVPDDPRVLCADLSAGLFLLRTNGYAVLSTVSRTVEPVRPRRADDPAVLGVISCNGRSMVVGLEYKRSSPKARLHYYLNLGAGAGAGAAWTTKEVDNPLLPLGLTGNFISKDVIAHDGRLWWVSDSNNAAAAGLLSCDPSADNPQLVFSAGSDLLGHCQHHPCSKIPRADRRCVQVADGKLRWVQILCEHTLPRGSGEAPAVCVLTLDDHTAQWTRSEDRHLMSFADVWNDDSYKRTPLPRKEPAIALIDPGKLFGFDTVYFSLDRYLFGVDMVTKKVVDGPHRQGMMLDSEDSSSPLLPWVVPSELRSYLLEAVAPLVV
ncbi:hypothetical protein BS78_02G363200 [Paspalum vaginatum]|nr:hypothetical protein BS78_02G363200 [Paspalum vaginatum]